MSIAFFSISFSTVGPETAKTMPVEVSTNYGEIIAMDDVRRNFANGHIEKPFLSKTTSQNTRKFVMPNLILRCNNRPQPEKFRDDWPRKIRKKTKVHELVEKILLVDIGRNFANEHLKNRTEKINKGKTKEKFVMPNLIFRYTSQENFRKFDLAKFAEKHEI